MGMLNLRRRVMKGGDDIPYQRVEYLEVTSQSAPAYIDTEYIPQGLDIEIYIKFMPIERLATSSVWFNTFNSAIDNINTTRIWRIIQVSTDFINICNMSINTISIGMYAYNKVVHEVQLLPTKIVVDGNTYNNPTTADGENHATLILFNGHSKSIQIAGRMYYFKLNKAGVPILDLLPVRIGDVGYMYDKVSGKLFGNSGEGKFILGPDI